MIGLLEAVALLGGCATSLAASLAAYHKGRVPTLLRQAKGLTQEEFARELEVTVGTLSGWEAGRHRPVRAQRKRLLQMTEASGIAPPPAAASGHQ